jgi:RNA polymerase sigma-70 factor (ECF subfamily)
MVTSAIAASQVAADSAPHDDDLIGRVAGRDHTAFEQLYRRYAPRLRAFLRGTLPRPGVIDEVIDDTMLVVWRKAHVYDGSAKLSTWIFGIAQRKALKALHRTRQLAGALVANGEMNSAGPEREMFRHDLRRHVTRALQRLPAQQSNVLRLTYFDGYDCREIAGIMNCPVDTVKTRAFHARRKLRIWLERCAFRAE